MNPKNARKSTNLYGDPTKAQERTTLRNDLFARYDVVVQELDYVLRVGAGQENFGYALLLESRQVLLGDYPAD
jgi:hypothetical protein